MFCHNAEEPFFLVFDSLNNIIQNKYSPVISFSTSLATHPHLLN